ncbi:MAG: hypothetical protein IPJ20_18070 [Flammeovirgaceae bacterium]|nr:hypothetical protein [Flammeovirgaceae bacterium]
MDVDGLWLPFEYTQGVIFNGVNVYDHWSFYPGLQDIQVKEAKYTYGAENPNKYVIGYAKPSFMDGSEEITDSYLTKYSENGIVQYAADTEKTLKTISGDEYYYTTLYKLKSLHDKNKLGANATAKNILVKNTKGEIISTRSFICSSSVQTKKSTVGSIFSTV